MAVDARRSRTALAPNRTVLYGVLTLAALSVIGAIISVASDLSATFLDAMGPKGRLSIPLPMTVAQIAMAVAAGSSRRIVAMIGSGFVAASLFAGVISGFFDGGLANDDLTPGLVAYQALLLLVTAAVGVLGTLRLREILRG